MADNKDDIYQYQPLWENWYIDTPIGKGSFGSVYKISREDMGHKYTSAVKIISIPSDEQYKEAEATFGGDEASLSGYFEDIVHNIINEVNMLYNLSGNSNIVDYQDHKVVKKEDRIGWDILIRMEYVTALKKYIAGHQMSKGEIIQLGIDICSALELCSKKGIIHRDIKDDNIFVNQDGAFKLGDFGISKELSKSGRAASMRGTPLYMAPEVYRGDKYDAAVDIYSLGIVLYKLLNHGRMPFMPPYPEMIRFKDGEAALDKRMSGQQLPQPDQAGEVLGKVIIKACAYQSENRYATATEMKRELESVLSRLPDAAKDELVTMLNTKSQESSPTVGLFGAELAGQIPESTDKPENELEKETETEPEAEPATDSLLEISAEPKKFNKPSKKVIVSIAATIVVVLTLFIAFNSADNSIEYGNSAGNIDNAGIAAQQGDWVYYMNWSDNEYLYKIQTDGTERTKLSSDPCSYINVVGDWIFYINGSDRDTVYKIRTNGKSRKKLNDDISFDISVAGDWIYYMNGSDNYTLYKMRTDGTKKTKLNSDESEDANIIGDWIYYKNCSDNGYLYKIQTDGTGRTKFNGDQAYNINVNGGWIYYRNVSEGNWNIYKIETDGTGKTKLNSDYNSDYINVVGDWIYYINTSDNRSIYKIRTDGTGRTKLNSDDSSFINVVGDWVYYIVRIDNDGRYLYKIRMDGTDRQKVE
jgi:serine/threonine protein kinase